MFPALSLIFEKGEDDLMKRPPRDSKEHLVSWLLIAHGCFFIGLFTSIFSCFIFFWSMWSQDITPSELFFCFANWKPGFNGFTESELNSILTYSQSATFLSIVIMQSSKPYE
jgi:sodium/potassium-transporting ATPase subunit alpha